MPRYYCDYCDAYLTHDSMAGRQQHMRGWRHRESYRNYYQQFYPQWAMGHTAYLQSQGVMPMPMPGMPGMPPAPFMGMPPPQSADGQRLQPLPFPPGMQNPPPMFRPPPSFAPPPSAHST